jgi:hypothetical protein
MWVEALNVADTRRAGTRVPLRPSKHGDNAEGMRTSGGITPAVCEPAIGPGQLAAGAAAKRWIASYAWS